MKTTAALKNDKRENVMTIKRRYEEDYSNW